MPIKAPVAGIAMGLIKEGDDYVILTDIAGVEDHLGDMDFKVAGTEDGITALQMDIKITGVTFEIMRDALAQAKIAREFILGEMAKVIEHPRTELSKHAPRISTIQIDPEKIGLLIGKGGETIRALQEEFESQIDVNDEGQVLVYAADGERGDALVDRIRSMTKEVEVGDEFTGKVVKTTDVRRLHRARQGHRRSAPHLQRRSGPPDRDGRGGAQQGRRAERPRGRGRPRAWPDRPAARRRPGCRRQERRGARHRRQRRRRTAAPRPRRPRWPRRPRTRRDRDRDRGPRTVTVTAPRVTATAAGCATATPTARAPEPPDVAQEHQLTTLESGVRIVTEAMPSVRSVSLGFWIGTGSRTESDEQAGLSHLLEHLLFKGSSKYESLEIDQIFDAMGAELNAGTGKETTSVYARVIDQHVPEAFDVMADMVFRPALSDIDSERAVILEEIAMYEDDPQEKVFDVLGEAVFGEHPLGRAIIGRAP